MIFCLRGEKVGRCAFIVTSWVSKIPLGSQMGLKKILLGLKWVSKILHPVAPFCTLAEVDKWEIFRHFCLKISKLRKKVSIFVLILTF